MREHGRAHGGVGDAVGEPRLQRRPAPARPRVGEAAPRAGLQLRRRRTPGTTSRTRTASRACRAGGWARARRSTSPRPRPSAGGASRPSACSSWGSQGIKADDGEGFYFPPDVRFADGRTGAEAAWDVRAWYRRSMQRALDEVHPRRGRAVRRAPGWTGQQAIGVHLGRRPAVGLLVAAHAGGGDADRRGRGLLELVARRRRLPRRAAGRALPEGAAAALGPVRLLHAADAGARALPAGGVDLRRARRSQLYREYVLLHERLVPYVRAAAATAARSGLPIIRPLLLIDPADRARLGDRRRVRLRPVAVGRAGAGGGRARARGRPAARRLDRLLDARARRAAAARSWPRRRSGASRCGCARARSWSPTRRSTSPPGWATRPRRAPAGGDAVGRAAARAAGVRLADGTACAGRAASGRWTASARSRSRSAERAQRTRRLSR